MMNKHLRVAFFFSRCEHLVSDTDTGAKIALKNANTCWPTGPTKACSLLLIWKKGNDSKKPSTRPMYAVRPVRTPLGPVG